jgi:hypothetical protein
MNPVLCDITYTKRPKAMHLPSSCWKRKIVYTRKMYIIFTCYRYKDKAAIEAHSKSEDFKTMGRTMKKEDLLAAPMKGRHDRSLCFVPGLR